MGHPLPQFSEGKTTYWVNYQRFFNDSYTRDGKQRAVNYCLANNIDPSEIIEFDSQLECDRYEFLLDLKNKGLIEKLTHHESLKIIPEFQNYNGDIIPELRLNSDFTYVDLRSGKPVNVVEDVKGASLFQDTRFEAVKAIFDYVYRDKTYIRIVIKREGQWLEWHIGDRKKARTLLQKQRDKIHALEKEKHEKEMAENLKKRELARLQELKSLPKLTSAQRKRLAELEEKYGINIH